MRLKTKQQRGSGKRILPVKWHDESWSPRIVIRSQGTDEWNRDCNGRSSPSPRPSPPGEGEQRAAITWGYHLMIPRSIASSSLPKNRGINPTFISKSHFRIHLPLPGGEGRGEGGLAFSPLATQKGCTSGMPAFLSRFSPISSSENSLKP
jgi:hypothetical protein